MPKRFRSLVLLLTATLASGLARAACSRVSVFITLKDGRGCNAYMGHAGVAINEEYYDWGPASNKNGSVLNYLAAIYGGKGREYDDRNVTYRDQKTFAKAEDIRGFLSGKNALNEDGDDTFNRCTAFEVRAAVAPLQAGTVQYFWDWVYESRPYFHVLKNQCTNLVFSSLKYSKLLAPGRAILLPQTLLKKLKAEFVSTCGPQKGKPAQLIQLYPPAI